MAKLSKENSLLVSHMMLHTGDKPYQCTKCDYAYKEHDQVSNIMIHTVDKPYKCRHSIGHSHRIVISRNILVNKLGSHTNGANVIKFCGKLLDNNLTS